MPRAPEVSGLEIVIGCVGPWVCRPPSLRAITDPAGQGRGAVTLGVGAIPLAEMGGEPGRAPPGVPGGPRCVVARINRRPSSSPPSAVHRTSPLARSHPTSDRLRNYTRNRLFGARSDSAVRRVIPSGEIDTGERAIYCQSRPCFAETTRARRERSKGICFMPARRMVVAAALHGRSPGPPVRARSPGAGARREALLRDFDAGNFAALVQAIVHRN